MTAVPGATTWLPRLRPTLAAVALTTGLLTSAPSSAGAADEAAPLTCPDILGLRIPAREMSLPTSGGEVTATAPIFKLLDGQYVEYCQVDGAIRPVDPDAPDIRFRVAMPTKWNGDGVHIGGGGLNGTIPDVSAQVPFGPSGGDNPITRGYAVFASDSGHQADPLHLPSPSLDGAWAVNDEAVTNFYGDHLKKTHDAAAYVIEHVHGRRPARQYFAGGSTGGREALVVAQEWPRTYDGVIAVYPAWNNTAEVLFLGRITRQLAKPGAFLDTAKQSLLHTSVVNHCDAQDGLADRIISDERGCDFDPSTIRCSGGTNQPGCLSDLQIQSVRMMSRPWHWPYRLASGETHYPGFPFLSGADMRTPLLGMGSSAPADPMPPDSGYGMQYWEAQVKYFITRDPDNNSLTLDPAALGQWHERVNALSLIADRNEADLSAFRRAGGKMILMHGAADELVSHRSTNDYFRRVRSILGRQATRDFLRYHVVPGANHGNLGAVFKAEYDSLTALTAWVEQGRAPRSPVVVDGNTGQTRPMCHFPRWPRYVSGDRLAASSFRCVK